MIQQKYLLAIAIIFLTMLGVKWSYDAHQGRFKIVSLKGEYGNVSDDILLDTNTGESWSMGWFEGQSTDSGKNYSVLVWSKIKKKDKIPVFKKVEFEGKIYNFPDNASDEEISATLKALPSLQVKTELNPDKNPLDKVIQEPSMPLKKK